METGFLAPLLDHRGPWASVYLDTRRNTQDALTQQRLRERSVIEQLAEAGADARTRDAIAEHLAAEPVSAAPPGRALFAAGAEVVLDVPLEEAPHIGEATWSTLPRLGPLVTFHDETPRCLVALVDSTGADLELASDSGREPLGRAEGEEWRGRGHRSVPTDRYEWHYRNRVENGLNRTADTIADALTRHWGPTGARLAVLAGEPRLRRAVHQRLPEQLRNRTVETETGNRKPGSSPALLDEAVARARRAHARRHLEDVVGTFRAGRGRPGEHHSDGTGPGQSAEGVPAVVEAARGRQMSALLLAEECPDGKREVWIGSGPEQIALRRTDAQATGVARPESAPAVDALIRAATASDTEVLLVPAGLPAPAGGCGAVLRWTVRQPEEVAR